MAKRGRPTNNPWRGTTDACERLGVSRWTLASWRDSGDLRKGYHWKVKNPRAARLTYLWHVDRLETFQGDVLTG